MPTGTPATGPMPTPTSEPTLPPTVNPGPAVFPPWQPDHLVARTADASVAVHKVVISEGLITLLYSIELAHADPHRTILVSPSARLVGSGPEDALPPTVKKILYHGVDVSLGALSFEGHSLDSAFYSLVIPELSVSRMSDGRETTIPGPWVISVIKEHESVHDTRQSWFPHQYWDGRAHSDRRDVRLRHNPVGYEGESSIGWIVTSGFYFLHRPVYFMVRPDGNVVEISEEWYVNIDQLLEEIK